jgi:hypothetical protein
MLIEHLPNVVRQILSAEGTCIPFLAVVPHTLLDPELQGAVFEQVLNGFSWRDFLGQ